MRSRTILLGALIVLVIISIFVYTIWKKETTGEELSKKHCSACHQYPEPTLLTKSSWTYLLTYMGFYQGIIDYSYLQGSPKIVLDNMRSKEMTLQTAHAIPQQPLLSQKEWKAIRDFYEKHAPEKPLPQEIKKSISDTLKQFKVRIPDFQPERAIVTMVKIDEKNGGLLIADNKNESLTFLDNELRTVKSYQGYDLVVDSYTGMDSLLVLSIGDLMGRYVGGGNGYVFLSKGTPEKLERFSMISSNLQRPCDMEFADLDKDGAKEIIVCNFGDVTGSLQVLGKDERGMYKLKKELSKQAGIVKSQVRDLNADGLPDIVVLMGDARENVSIFYNRGNLEFEQKTVIEFNSAYGSTYFEMHDFNEDGHVDIMTVNGDSDADPYNTLKPYHGIRIFLNDGKDNFAQRYFYPMHGVHFAKANDFDKDGDFDIAAVSFFPDFDSAKPEVFTYLQNEGDFNFSLSTDPVTLGSRWMVMDIGDYDQDNDVDIVIGAAYLPLGMIVKYSEQFSNMSRTGKAIMVFENRLH